MEAMCAMNCREIKKKLSAYQDNELPPLQRNEIAAHLKKCAGCSRALQELNEVWETLSNVETIESAPFFWTRLSQRIRAPKQEPGILEIFFAPIRRLANPVFATLILIIGLAAGIYLGEKISQQSSPASPVSLEQELEQELSLSSFDDFPQESVAEVYVTLLSENNQH